MTRLAGKVCVVTGATGMAADAARRFAAEGAQVWVIDRDPGQCEALGLPFAVADLRDEAAAEAAFAAVRAACPRIDALYAVAGASGRRIGDGPAHELSLAAWDGTL
ncbi:MAG TPA: SDR family NAD(P)-dependent oxidoreductase, partial [Actinomycetota bacterium]|nr:SDR family NAD(P)-dependent oxidoreductase [Actinomycetota bacterium]